MVANSIAPLPHFVRQGTKMPTLRLKFMKLKCKIYAVTRKILLRVQYIFMIVVTSKCQNNVSFLLGPSYNTFRDMN